VIAHPDKFIEINDTSKNCKCAAANSLHVLGSLAMSSSACDVEGELEITTPAGPIRCVGTGSAFEIVFQNLRQLVRATRPFRSGPARLIVDRLLATAAPTDIEVKLRIGRRIVADVETPRGQDRSRIRLRFLNLVAAAFRGS
jgi:hypothetical protein